MRVWGSDRKCALFHTVATLATAEDLHNPELTAEDSTIMDNDDNLWHSYLNE